MSTKFQFVLLRYSKTLYLIDFQQYKIIKINKNRGILALLDTVFGSTKNASDPNANKSYQKRLNNKATNKFGIHFKVRSERVKEGKAPFFVGIAVDGDKCPNKRLNRLSRFENEYFIHDLK